MEGMLNGEEQQGHWSRKQYGMEMLDGIGQGRDGKYENKGR